MTLGKRTVKFSLSNVKVLVLLSILLITGCNDKKNDPLPEGNANGEVSVTSPGNSNTNVGRNKTLTVRFTEAMDAGTINTRTFSLNQGITPVPGTVVYVGTTAYFNPTATLAAGTTYTATMTTGVKDLSGNEIASNEVWSFVTGNTTSGQPGVYIGTAINYVVLAKEAISNNSTSVITGDLGLSPAGLMNITGLELSRANGFAVSRQVAGSIFAADIVSPNSSELSIAISDMVNAYKDAAARPSPDFIELEAGNIGGRTLSQGLYKWTGSVSIPTNITILGGADDIWIFQIDGNLTQEASVSILLSGGAQAKNIFWVVGGAVSLASNSHFEGVILSKNRIALGSAASLNGHVFGQTDVLFDANTVARPN